MKTYPKQKIGSRAYIGESMLKILICDDDPTFAQSMFKRILSLPAYSSKSMKLSCLTDIAEMSANTMHSGKTSSQRQISIKNQILASKIYPPLSK